MPHDGANQTKAMLLCSVEMKSASASTCVGSSNSKHCIGMPQDRLELWSIAMTLKPMFCAVRLNRAVPAQISMMKNDSTSLPLNLLEAVVSSLSVAPPCKASYVEELEVIRSTCSVSELPADD